MTKNQIAQFVKERDAAVRTFDIETFKKFYERWKKKGVYEIPLPSDEILEIAIRKAAVHSINLTDEERQKAAEWLTERGYSTDLL